MLTTAVRMPVKDWENVNEYMPVYLMGSDPAGSPFFFSFVSKAPDKINWIIAGTGVRIDVCI